MANFEDEKEASFFEQISLSSNLNKSNELPDDIIRLKLHATTGYSLTRSSTMTSNPVADGSDRTDHYVNNIATIKLNGVIADNINPFRFNRNEKTSQDYTEEVKRLQDSKSIVTVVLPEVGYFENCMIKSFSPSRKTATGLGSSVSITFQQLLVATIGNVRKVSLENTDALSAPNDSGSGNVTKTEMSVFENLESLDSQDKIAYMKKLEELKDYVGASANLGVNP